MTVKFPLAFAVVLLASGAAFAEPATNPGVPNTGAIVDKTAEQSGTPQTGANDTREGDADSSHIGGMGTKASKDGKGGPTNEN